MRPHTERREGAPHSCPRSKHFLVGKPSTRWQRRPQVVLIVEKFPVWILTGLSGRHFYLNKNPIRRSGGCGTLPTSSVHHFFELKYAVSRTVRAGSMIKSLIGIFHNWSTTIRYQKQKYWSGHVKSGRDCFIAPLGLIVIPDPLVQVRAWSSRNRCKD